MFRRHYNLVMVGFWLFVMACLVIPDVMLPDKLRQHIRAPAGMMVGLLAFAFAVYNFARWWSYQALYRNRAIRKANPLEVRKLDPADEKYEPNPALDFLKVPDAEDDASRPREGSG